MHASNTIMEPRLTITMATMTHKKHTMESHINILLFFIYDLIYDYVLFSVW